MLVIIGMCLNMSVIYNNQTFIRINETIWKNHSRPTLNQYRVNIEWTFKIKMPILQTLVGCLFFANINGLPTLAKTISKHRYVLLDSVTFGVLILAADIRIRTFVY